MKKLFWSIVAYTLIVVTCSRCKLSLPEDNGCIERVAIPVTAHIINAADVLVINNLFSINGIDNSRFRYYQYTHDSLQTGYSPFTKYDQKTVRVYQYTKDIPIFTGTLSYNFLNNKFNAKGGNLTNGTSLNNSSKLSLGQIRRLFLDNAEQFEDTPNKYRDSCFKAEFGYYNLNAGIGYTQENLVKVWKVTLKNSSYPSEFPVAYFHDNDGKLIYYDNGVRRLK